MSNVVATDIHTFLNFFEDCIKKVLGSLDDRFFEWYKGFDVYLVHALKYVSIATLHDSSLREFAKRDVAIIKKELEDVADKVIAWQRGRASEPVSLSPLGITVTKS